MEQNRPLIDHEEVLAALFMLSDVVDHLAAIRKLWRTMKKRKKSDRPKPEWQVRSEEHVRWARELAEKGMAELEERRKRQASA